MYFCCYNCVCIYINTLILLLSCVIFSIIDYFTKNLMYYSRTACAAKMADGNDPVADLDPNRNGSSDDMDEPHCTACSADTPLLIRPQCRTLPEICYQ